MKQHMLQFRLNDKQWNEINHIREKYRFDNNGQLYKFLFLNAMLGVQKKRELDEIKKISNKLDKALGRRT